MTGTTHLANTQGRVGRLVMLSILALCETTAYWADCSVLFLNEVSQTLTMA